MRYWKVSIDQLLQSDVDCLLQVITCFLDSLLSQFTTAGIAAESLRLAGTLVYMKL